MASENMTAAPVAGLNQSKKLITKGRASEVYLAHDADAAIIQLIGELCSQNGISPDLSKTKGELRELCGIEVDCAVCVVPKS